MNPFSAFILHLHPRTVPVKTIRFTLSFGLGGMAATLLLVMVSTGLLQLIQYSPNPEEAYASIEQMYALNGFGGYIRNIHFWAGNLLVVIAALHLARVFFTGALSGKRRINWILGIGIFLLLLFSNFTGYLLPWDQLAYWAVTVFTNMTAYIPVLGNWLAMTLRGGGEVGRTTLVNFFALHVGVLPCILILLLACHFWLVRRAGGLVHDGIDKSMRAEVNPHLITREVVIAFILLAVLLNFAALIDSPLSQPANPGESPNPAKAAWYFMGLQELLLHLHPAIAICFVPALMLLELLAVPFIRNATLPEGIWFGGKRGFRLALMIYMLCSLFTIAAVWLDDKLLQSQSIGTAGSLLMFRGVLPVFLVCLMQGGLYIGLRRLGLYSRAECVMAVVITIFAIISGLTIVGIWFRGSGMQLVWPA